MKPNYADAIKAAIDSAHVHADLTDRIVVIMPPPEPTNFPWMLVFYIAFLLGVILNLFTLFGSWHHTSPCNECHGSGFRRGRDCNFCHGSGMKAMPHLIFSTNPILQSIIELFLALGLPFVIWASYWISRWGRRVFFYLVAFIFTGLGARAQVKDTAWMDGCNSCYGKTDGHGHIVGAVRAVNINCGWIGLHISRDTAALDTGLTGTYLPYISDTGSFNTFSGGLTTFSGVMGTYCAVIDSATVHSHVTSPDGKRWVYTGSAGWTQVKDASRRAHSNIPHKRSSPPIKLEFHPELGTLWFYEDNKWRPAHMADTIPWTQSNGWFQDAAGNWFQIKDIESVHQNASKLPAKEGQP